MPASVWAIIVAGGDGRRFGGPKQFATLHGQKVVEWALDGARSVTENIVLVVPPSLVGDESVRELRALVVAGRSTRSGSVRAGLGVVPKQAEIVVVHDAARPLASPMLFRSVIEAVTAGADGVVPAIAIADTVKRVDSSGVILETLDRSSLFAVQTPQAFRAEALFAAHASEADATDDAMLLEAIGRRVVVVAGSPQNQKLTEPSDLALFERLLGERESDVRV